MPSFNFTLKAVSRFVSHRNLSPNQLLKCSNYDKIRCLYSIASADVVASCCFRKKPTDSYLPELGISNAGVVIQKRGFLGCGDGAEGNMSSKAYEERRVLGYSPEQLYAVVAAVELYEDFLPWCQRSKIIQHHPDGSFDAELEIGFKFLVERYVSHVEFNKSKSVKTTSSQSSIFDHLINVWEFNPGPVPGTCNLYFFVDFKLQSPLYRQMVNIFFKEVVSRLVGSFNERCHSIYGPGVLVNEKTFEEHEKFTP